MVLPWVKLGALSLNASVSATVGGVCTYCIFGGENKEERQQIDAVYLQLKQEEEQFEVDKKNLEKEQAKLLEGAKATLLSWQKVESCLKDKEDVYKRTQESLGWQRPFKIVRYSGEYCFQNR